MFSNYSENSEPFELRFRNITFLFHTTICIAEIFPFDILYSHETAVNIVMSLHVFLWHWLHFKYICYNCKVCQCKLIARHKLNCLLANNLQIKLFQKKKFFFSGKPGHQDYLGRRAAVSAIVKHIFYLLGYSLTKHIRNAESFLNMR